MANPAAMWMAVVVFPTPPFMLTTANLRMEYRLYLEDTITRKCFSNARKLSYAARLGPTPILRDAFPPAPCNSTSMRATDEKACPYEPRAIPYRRIATSAKTVVENTVGAVKMT